MTNTQRIVELNDQYRKSLGVPGVPFVFTSGISALRVEDRAAILEKVKTFNEVLTLTAQGFDILFRRCLFQ